MIAYGRRRPPLAPPARTMGRTGSTHGETAVITPARKAIPSRTVMYRLFGLGRGVGCYGFEYRATRCCSWLAPPPPAFLCRGLRFRAVLRALGGRRLRLLSLGRSGGLPFALAASLS